MSIPFGKIIGALIGYFAFHSIIGALAGLGVGHIFDLGLRRQRESQTFADLSTEEKQRIETAFFNAIYPLLGHMAKADGRVSEDEIATAEQMMGKMGLDTEARKRAIDLFKAGTQPDFELQNVAQEFNQVCGEHRELKQIFLVYLITLALADGHLHEKEEEVLGQVAKILEYSSFAFNHLLGMVKAQNQFYKAYSKAQQENYRQQSARSSADDLALAYKAMGLESSVTDADLKKAYRKLMSENHPDKLAGQGVPEDVIKMATERSQEIQAAYDMIKKSRKA